MIVDMDRMWTRTVLKDSGLEAAARLNNQNELILELSSPSGSFKFTITANDLTKLDDMVRILREHMIKAGV